MSAVAWRTKKNITYATYMSHAKFFLSSKWHFTIYYLKVSKNHVECDCRKWHLFKASAYSRRLLKCTLLSKPCVSDKRSPNLSWPLVWQLVIVSGTCTRQLFVVWHLQIVWHISFLETTGKGIWGFTLCLPCCLLQLPKHLPKDPQKGQVTSSS